MLVGRGARELAGVYLEAHLAATARDLLSRAVTALERGGASAAERAETLREQAVAATLCGELAPAEGLLRRVLALQEAALGEHHPELGRTLGTLAEVLRLVGRPREADPLLRRALEVQESALGPEHPQVGKTLTLLALLEQQLDRPAQALELLERAVAIAAGARSPDLLSALHSLGVVQVALGRAHSAACTFEQLIDLIERAGGGEQLDLVPPLNSLAALRVRQGRGEEGLRLYRRALALLERSVGPEHPDVAAVLNNLAEVHLRSGDLVEGEAVLRRSLALRERALGPAHPDVAESLNNLGGLLLRQGRAGEAAALLERALDIWLTTIGPDHARTASTRAALHQAHRAQAQGLEGSPPTSVAAHSPERLALLAWVGDAAARGALGDAAPELPDALSEWILGLARWGETWLVHGLVAACEAALPEFAALRPGDTRLLQVLAAARAWAQDPQPLRAEVTAGAAPGAAQAAGQVEPPGAAAVAWAVHRLALAVGAAGAGDQEALHERAVEAIEAAERAIGPRSLTAAVARDLRARVLR